MAGRELMLGAASDWAFLVARDMAPQFDKAVQEIGKRFGNRDHTTVMHAIKKVESTLGKDADVDDALRSVTSRLGADRRD